LDTTKPAKVLEQISRTTDRLVLKLTHHFFRVSYPTDGQVFQWEGGSLKPPGKTVGLTHLPKKDNEIYQDWKEDLKEIRKKFLKKLELMKF